VLDNQSQCAILPYNNTFIHKPTRAGQEGCWHPRTFEKAVVVVIDALRYDFTVPFRPTSQDPRPRFFHNAIPILYQTAQETPGNAFLLPFIADPPTTTLQRLKGLTTGTLPTFIEAGSNFAGTAIEEDNVLLQLRKVGKTLVHLGDDTWNSLFPGYFHPNLTHAYDSFNVRDLHTVDNGVIEHLMPLLQFSAASQWDVIFGHFLGVDHAGHRYGPDHQAMTEKLKQMDGVIRDIMQSIDENTLLVVMGDHGMDGKGDHGGESDEEVEAAIWFYSKRRIFGRTQPSYTTPPKTAKERPIRQIDLITPGCPNSFQQSRQTN
jgi:phosphatidylinositol glycan class O